MTKRERKYHLLKRACRLYNVKYIEYTCDLGAFDATCDLLEAINKNMNNDKY